MPAGLPGSRQGAAWQRHSCAARSVDADARLRALRHHTGGCAFGVRRSALFFRSGPAGSRCSDNVKNHNRLAQTTLWARRGALLSPSGTAGSRCTNNVKNHNRLAQTALWGAARGLRPFPLSLCGDFTSPQSLATSPLAYTGCTHPSQTFTFPFSAGAPAFRSRPSPRTLYFVDVFIFLRYYLYSMQ